ncbi:hypothetical protein KDW_34500 [Dictyobacter vulcani]|uniref:Rieske domain-containing protein n=1 Tax=Dictyobacter vulcani TaxID=2607529 RepID=A0A5J4KHQ5_9CHLR|nr:Rieske 2Fe-2S domain-containing protein [Dictyobacter vulcani]GER89288.1 hypothetical protein KDW_34500 [Dictyobacter vulcani]
MVAKQQQPDEDVVALLTPGMTLAGTHATDAELMKAYEWWSPAEPVQAPPAPAPSRSAQPPAAPMVLPSTDMLDWGLSDTPTSAVTKNKKRPQQGSPARPSTQKMNRRSVVALLASGAVVAGGVGLAFNLGKLTAPFQANQPLAQQPAPAQNTPQKPATNPVNQKQPVKNPPAKPQNGGNTTQKPAAPGHVGTVVGSQNQPVNSAISFNNPADQQASLLVRLPAGTFVAYEKACTHEGVKVNYDPATKMFVCPAHGAIFDPANGGRVVQGPADAPLPPVKVNVNADGTITAV